MQARSAANPLHFLFILHHFTLKHDRKLDLLLITRPMGTIACHEVAEETLGYCETRLLHACRHARNATPQLLRASRLCKEEAVLDATD